MGKDFFGYPEGKQGELIRFAEAQATHTEKTFQDKEEAELGEGWDLNAAEDATTECLADQEENDVSE
jgi:hypothetical protein